jgi:hypothetical protein
MSLIVPLSHPNARPARLGICHDSKAFRSVTSVAVGLQLSTEVAENRHNNEDPGAGFCKTLSGFVPARAMKRGQLLVKPDDWKICEKSDFSSKSGEVRLGRCEFFRNNCSREWPMDGSNATRMLNLTPKPR